MEDEKERKTLFPIRNYLQVLAIIWNLLFLGGSLLRHPSIHFIYFSELSLAQRKLFPLKTSLNVSPS